MISLPTIGVPFAFLPRLPRQTLSAKNTTAPLRHPAVPFTISVSPKPVFMRARGRNDAEEEPQEDVNKNGNVEEEKKDDDQEEQDTILKEDKVGENTLLMLETAAIREAYTRKMGRDARALYLHYMKIEKHAELEKHEEMYQHMIESAMEMLRGNKDVRGNSEYDEHLIFMEAFLDTPCSPDPAADMERKFPNMGDKGKGMYLHFMKTVEVEHLEDDDADAAEEEDGKEDGGKGENP